jgi:dTMP kinase
LKGKLIIIEAGDGCGKATQTEKLYSRLLQEGHPVRKISFPNYASRSSELIKMYLNGEFGNRPEDVTPYAASSFYAVDRYASYKQDWGNFYEQGGIILADRYTTSNMVHQAVKIREMLAREAFLEWLWDLEFNKFGLPVPDAVIFLDLPPQVSRKLREGRADKAGGTKPDIHERNEDYLCKCYDSYCALADKYGWQRIQCTEGQGIKSIDHIHEEIYDVVHGFI